MGARHELSAGEFADGMARVLAPLADGLKSCLQEAGDDDSRLAAVVGRLRRLVDDLRACSGRQALQPGTLVPAAVLAQFASAVRPILDRRLELRVLVDEDCPPCHADGRALQDALLCLVANARDAMPDGGEVALTARLGRFDDGTRAAEFGVRDHGPGMNAELMATATLPFVTTKPGASDGLGLAVVAGFALQSGGRLRLLSGREGTSALLLLPCAAPADRPTAPD